MENLEERMKKHNKPLHEGDNTGRTLLVLCAGIAAIGSWWVYGFVLDDKDVPYEREIKQIVREYKSDKQQESPLFPESQPIDSEGVYEGDISGGSGIPQSVYDKEKTDYENQGALFLNETTGELIRVNEKGFIVSYDKPEAVNELMIGGYISDHKLLNEWEEKTQDEQQDIYFFQNLTDGTIISVNKHYRIQSIEEPLNSDTLEKGVYINDNTLLNEWEHIEE